MRITPETLMKIARDTVDLRSKADRDILAAFVHGSLLDEDPLLGGTADIDLFLISNSDFAERREIVRLTDDVHLDITHQPRKMYRQGKELRLHPWIGPTVYHCKILYDPQHFLDFTQASVRGQFNRPENVLGRARQLAEHARQVWLSFQMEPKEPGIEDQLTYLKAVEKCGNAIASLSGPPLTERRFLLQLPQRAEAAGNRGLYNGFLGLIGGPSVDASQLQARLPGWQAAYEAIPQAERPPRLHIQRLSYYRRAIESLVAGDTPLAALWPLVRTWVLAVHYLPAGSPHHETWSQAASHLGLAGPAFIQRIEALDAYLDLVEETLETWAQKNGV